MIGESPTRPAIFHASPLVVVTPDISPLEFSARQLIVPVGGCMATSIAQASVLSSTCGNCSFSSAVAAVPASSSPDQLVWPLLSRIDRFHTTHAMRESSTSRSSVLNPLSRPYLAAPPPP